MRQEFSKSTVSDLCQGLDATVHAWNERDLSGSQYLFLLVDALVLKVREGVQVRSVSALVAVGTNEQGHREILGLQIGDSESEASWTALFITTEAVEHVLVDAEYLYWQMHGKSSFEQIPSTRCFCSQHFLGIGPVSSNLLV